MGWFSRLFHKHTKQPQLTAEDCCAQGKQLFDAGKYLEAMEFFQVAIEKDAQKEEAYKSLIDTYRVLGREQDAQRTIKELQKAVPKHKPISQTRKPIPSKQRPAKKTPTSPKSKNRFVDLLFGERIELSKKDKYAILAGGIFESIVLVFSFFLGLEDERPLFWCMLFFIVYSVVSIAIVGETKTISKQPGAGVTIACYIGGFISMMAPFFSLSYVGIPYLSIYLFIIICFVLSYTIGRFKRASKTQGRLFGYSLATIMLLLIIIFSIPLVLRYNTICGYKRVCKESIELRNEHLKQEHKLGFMGVDLDDYFGDVFQLLSNDNNVVGPVSNIENPNTHIDNFDVKDYHRLCYVQTQYVELDFDKGLQCNVTFDNGTSHLSVFFWNDHVKLIQLDSEKEDLYKQKYSTSEYYYTIPPKMFIRKGDKYPYFGKYSDGYTFYDRIAQWTYANGVIRVNYHNSMYITNDVFDTITARDERAQRRAEQLRIEQEERERQQELERERQEKEAAERQALEQLEREEARRQAIEQI